MTGCLYLTVPATHITRPDDKYSHASLMVGGGTTIEVHHDRKEGLVEIDGRVEIFLPFDDLISARVPRWVELIGATVVRVTVHQCVNGFGEIYDLVPGWYSREGAEAEVHCHTQLNKPYEEQGRDVTTVEHGAVITLTATSIAAARGLYLAIMSHDASAEGLECRRYGLPLREIDDRLIEVRLRAVNSVLTSGVKPEGGADW